MSFDFDISGLKRWPVEPIVQYASI